MSKLLIFLIIFLPIVFLGGCGGTKTIVVEIVTEKEANNGNAVVVTIYQLINADKFRYASFESLIKNPVETLGADIVPNSKYERTMVPGENFMVEAHEIKNDALFLGIVADFHSPAKDGWKQVIPLESGFSDLKISIHESSLSVAFD